jgi:hypothetical protein
VVALEPARLQVLCTQAGRDSAVGGHRALAVRIDERDDHAAPAVHGPRPLDASQVELAGEELAGGVVPTPADQAGIRAELCGPGADVRGLPAGTRLGRGKRVRARCQRLCKEHDDVEEEVSERNDEHGWQDRGMDGEERRGRVSSFVIGGVLGASAALATARRRRPRRSAERRTPQGLEAFEGAPCYREVVEQEREAERQA